LNETGFIGDEQRSSKFRVLTLTDPPDKSSSKSEAIASAGMATPLVVRDPREHISGNELREEP